MCKKNEVAHPECVCVWGGGNIAHSMSDFFGGGGGGWDILYESVKHTHTHKHKKCCPPHSLAWGEGKEVSVTKKRGA